MANVALFVVVFQFTHPGRGATQARFSIHCGYIVSIHAPREGCDGHWGQMEVLEGGFQFTHPGRGATVSSLSSLPKVLVSIHAPREGCDLLVVVEVADGLPVSIHAPREGCDLTASIIVLHLCSFNSRTPGGVRLVPDSDYSGVGMFQFTHPGRGATIQGLGSLAGITVSIHAPREGCDLSRRYTSSRKRRFQFTHPGRGATALYDVEGGRHDVSIHAPREGCDLGLSPSACEMKMFQFTHPGRGATASTRSDS